MELSAAEAGLLLTGRSSGDHKIAWLLDAVSRGAIEVDTSAGVVLRRGRVPGDSAVLDALFAAGEVPLEGYHPDFAKAWATIDAELDAWRRASGLWSRLGRLTKAGRRQRDALDVLRVDVLTGPIVPPVASGDGDFVTATVWATGLGFLNEWRARAAAMVESGMIADDSPEVRFLTDAVLLFAAGNRAILRTPYVGLREAGARVDRRENDSAWNTYLD